MTSRIQFHSRYWLGLRLGVVLLGTPVLSGLITTQAQAALLAPTNVKATAGAVGSKAITLTWNAPVGASAYKIWRSTSSAGPFKPIRTQTGLTYTQTKLTAGTTYYYKITAMSTTVWTDGPGSLTVSAKAR